MTRYNYIKSTQIIQKRGLLKHITKGNKYVCISYVWSQYPTIQDIEDRLDLICDKVISHDTMIWLDRISNKNADGTDNEFAINNMFDIYANATKVILLAPEMDEYFERAYIGDVGNTIRDDFMECNLIESIANSEWMKRAWTLQEAIAAKEIEYVGIQNKSTSHERSGISGEDIYYECGGEIIKVFSIKQIVEDIINIKLQYDDNYLRVILENAVWYVANNIDYKTVKNSKNIGENIYSTFSSEIKNGVGEAAILSKAKRRQLNLLEGLSLTMTRVAGAENKNYEPIMGMLRHRYNEYKNTQFDAKLLVSTDGVNNDDKSCWLPTNVNYRTVTGTACCNTYVSSSGMARITGAEVYKNNDGDDIIVKICEDLTKQITWYLNCTITREHATYSVVHKKKVYISNEIGKKETICKGGVQYTRTTLESHLCLLVGTRNTLDKFYEGLLGQPTDIMEGFRQDDNHTMDKSLTKRETRRLSHEKMVKWSRIFLKCKLSTALKKVVVLYKRNNNTNHKGKIPRRVS